MDKLNLILNHKTVTEDRIPSIPLYMDQVTGYLDEIFSDYKRNEEEKILTKTMINNYVKAKVIESPIRKKYSKDQIMQLIMIYKLKNVIQISEIEQILKDSTDDMFDIFSNIEENVKENVKDVVKDIDTSNRLEVILKLLLSANLQKKLAEVLIDEIKNSPNKE